MHPLPEPSDRRGRVVTPGFGAAGIMKGKTKMKAKKSDGTPAITEADVRGSLVLALQVAATIDGSPSVCRRAACRANGQCHLSLDTDNRIHCPGGVGRGTIDRAEGMLIFFARIWDRYDMIPAPCLAGAIAWVVEQWNAAFDGETAGPVKAYGPKARSASGTRTGVKSNV